MQRLGQALHVSRSRNIIVKVERVPKIGAKVVDENLEDIGKIIDVFGPVSSPYASVKPATQKREELPGEMLYVLPEKKDKG